MPKLSAFFKFLLADKPLVAAVHSSNDQMVNGLLKSRTLAITLDEERGKGDIQAGPTLHRPPIFFAAG
jgi:hypothetical protein